MDKKKVNLKAVVADKGKAAAGFLDKAKKTVTSSVDQVINSVDQNDDGKLDLKDLSVLSEQWNEKKEQVRRETDKRMLRPIFEEDLDSTGFLMPKLIRVVEMDKKHAESDVCQGSIGFESVHKDLRIVNIYPDKAAAFGLSYYPEMDCDVYYVDPVDRDHYIALDEYYNYLKVARVSELQQIAQDLGAKHFRVTYKEQKKSFSSDNVKGKLAAKGPSKQSGDAELSHEARSTDYSRAEIAAEMECIGHKPVAPKLVYFKNDPQIQSLISLRMSDNSMTHQIYTLVLSNSTGIKVKDAVKIDAALASMKYAGNVAVTKEAESEYGRYFEYEIDF